MKKSWKLAGSFGSSLINRFGRRGPRAARKVAAIAGEAVGLDSFGRLIGGLAPTLALALITTNAVAGPEGAQVANGNVSIQKQGDKTVIHASNNAIINYKNFDIAKNETVQFVQPDALARVLNRINSPSPTKIDGKLLANGKVFIVNPAGVIFGQGAVVNAAGIFAAAGNITDANFVKGIYKFTNVQGSVTNNGTIEAGNVALIGKSVANNGTIVADKGAVVMASGDSVMIGEQGGRMYVKVDAQQQDAGGSNASKDNSGGGWAVGDIYSLAIRNTGTIKGKTVHAEASKGVVNIGGTVDASSQTAGEKGGSVKLLGDYVGVSGTVDASGPAGGGEILVGGNFQGKGVEKNAIRTAVTSTASIKADATSNGDGGRVIVWADDQTNFAGSLSARGAGTGKGGFAEVSGKKNLNFTWNVDLSGPGGTGELLLDPATITIVGGTGDGAADGTGTFFGDPGATEGTVLFADIGPTTIFESEIEGLVANAAANIVLQATEAITALGIFDGGELSLGATNFTLSVSNDTAAGFINLTGVSITSTSGNILIEGSTSGIESNTISLGSISTGSGNITVTNGLGSIATTGVLSVGGGNLGLTTLNGQLIVNTGLSSSGAGNISLDSTGAQTVVLSNITNSGGSIIFGASGAAGLSLGGDISANTDITFNRSVTLAGPVIIGATGTVTANSTVNAGPNALSIVAGQVDFDGGAASVLGTGTLSIAPTSDATSISIGDAATGTFDLDTDDIDALGTSFSSITIGSATGTGLTTIGSAGFNSPTTIIQGGAGGQISLTNTAILTTSSEALTLAAGTGDSGLLTKPSGAVIATGNATITLTGDAMDIGGTNEINTSGGVIFQPATINRPIVVGGAGTAADLVLSEAEVSDAVTGESFVVIGQSSGQHAITIGGVTFGSATTIRTPSGGSITVDGTVSAPSIRLNGAKTFATGASVTTTAGDLLLDGGSSIVTGANVGLDAGTGTLTAGAIDIGTNILTLTGDEITINAGITGSGGSSLVLQPSAPNVSIDVGVNAGGTGTLDLSDPELANITGVGSLTIGRSNGEHTIVIRDVPISVPTTIRTPSGGSIAVNGAISAPGIRLQGTKTLNTSGAISATSGGTITLDGGTTTLTNNFFLTADEINLGSTVTGAFNLTLQPTTDGTSIGVGGGAGTLDISDTDLGNISGTTGVTIGRSGGTHVIEVSTASIADPITIRGGTITTGGTFTGTGDASVTLNGSAIQMGGNIVTAGQVVNIQGPVTLTANSSVDTTNAGGSAAGANVTFNNSINGQSTNGETLTITAGTGGTIDLQNVGTGTSLQTLSLNGGDLDFGNITADSIDFLSRTAINTSSLFTIGSLADFETRLTAGAGITLSNTNNTFGSIRVRTRSSDGTGGSVAGDVVVFESGDTTLTEGEAGGSFSFTSTGDIDLTGPLSAGTNITLEGVDFTSASGGFIQATDGNVLIDHTGAVVIGDSVDASLNGSDQDVTINGSSIAVNAAVSADDTVTLNSGSGATTVSGAVSSVSDNVIVTGGTVTLASGGSITAATTASITGSDDVNIADDVTATTSISIHSGTDGTGNVAFTGAGVDLQSPSITLRAGDGTGGAGTTASVDALTNAPSFRNAAGGATSPTTYVHRQDGNIANGQIANASQFQAATTTQGVAYTLQSDDGAVQLTDGSKVAGATLTITGANPFVIASNLDFGGGQITIGDADVQASGIEVTVGTGLLTFTGDLSINANNLTLTANEINFNGGAGSVTGTGDLVLRPSAAGFGIAVGAANVGGRFDITDTDLAAMASTFNLITVGRAGGTHAITIESAELTNPFLIRGGAIEVTTDGVAPGIGGTGRGSASLNGSAISLESNVLTESGEINFDGPITIAPATGNSVTVATTRNAATGADIAFNGTTNSDGTARDLVIDSGDGSAVLLGAVGGSQTLASLNVEAATISLPAVSTEGSQSYTGATTLSGDLASFSGGSIAIDGTTALTSSVTVQTGGGLNTDDITLSGAVTGGGNTLTLNAGLLGDVVVSANATGLSGFSATGGTISTRSITTTGSQSFTGVSSVTGNLVTSTAGGVTFTGNSTVNGNVTTTAGNILANNNLSLSGNLSTATSGTITVTGTTTLTGATQSIQTANGAISLAGVTGGSALTVNSGTAATTLGAVGATRLTSLAVTGSTINATSTVATTGNQTYTGATNLGGNLSTTGGDVLVVGGTTLTGPVQIGTTGGDVTLGTVAGGGNGFIVNAGAGAVDVAGNITGVSSFAATGATIGVADVTSTGSQIYNGSTTLNGDLASTTTGSITVNGAARLGDDIAITTAGGAVDDVTFNGAVAGEGNGLTVNTGGGDVVFNSDASGLSTLNATGATIRVVGVNSTGNQTYTGATTTLGNLETTGPGNIQVNGTASLGGNVTTADGNIAVTGTTTLAGSSPNVTANDGDVTFAAINGPANLSISAADGTVTLGTVGATALQSLAVTASQIDLTSTVNTTGGQTYDGPTEVTDNLTSAGGTIQFFQDVTVNDTVDNAVQIASNGGGIVFSTDLNGVGQAVTLNAGSGNVDLSGLSHDPTGTGVATLGSLTATGNDISVGRVTTSGPQSYTATNNVSTNSRLRSTANAISIDADNEVRLGGDLATNGGAITVAGTTVLGNTAVNVTSTGGAITFVDDIIGSADGVGALSVDGGATGAVVFQGDIGTAPNARIASIVTDGQSVSLRSINTSGSQTHSGPSLLNSTLTAGTSVTFSDSLTLGDDSSINAASASFQAIDAQTAGQQGLTVNTGSGAVAFNQPVGSTAALEFLNVTGTTTTGAVNTTGDQTYAGSTTANGNLTSGGALTATGAFATTANINVAGAMNITGGSENVSLTGSTTAASINVTGANVAVAGATSTAGGQTYQATNLTTIGGDLSATGGGITVNGPAELVNGDRTFTTSGGSAITLNQLDGNGSGLTLNAGTGNIVLNNTITELANFTATGAQITVPSLTTTGAQTYNGATVFGGNVNSTGGGNITTSGVANFSNSSQIETNGGVISLGGIAGGGHSVTLIAGTGSVNLTGNVAGTSDFVASAANITAANIASNGPVTLIGSSAISGNITAGLDIWIEGPTTLTGSSMQIFHSQNGGLTFGTIDSVDSTRRSLTLSSGVVPNNGTSAANIRLTGSVGATNPLATFRLGGTDPNAAVPPVSTVAFAPQFDATNGGVVRTAVDFANPQAFSINATNFEMSKGEKLTAFGDITINATEALLRDINSIGSIVVNAPTIRLAGRQRASLVSSGASIPELDIGLDFVGAKGVTFNGAASIENLDGGTEVTFGSNSLADVPPISGGTAISLVFDGGISAATFQRAGGNGDLLLALDLRADGRTTTNVATAIAGATPKEADIGPAQSVGISASLKDQLKEVGIYVKELSLDQQLDFLTGRAIYNDVPSNTASPSGSDYQITPNRLAVDRVRDVLEAHRAIKQVAMTGAAEDALWTDRAAEIIASAATACATALNKDVTELTGAELAEFVQSNPDHAQARDLLVALKDFMTKIDALGLSPGEASVPKETILSILAGRDLTPEQVSAAAQAVVPATVVQPVP
jgi:fibronectin-binding autotransporter adhesin